jgi:hypothetical protein
MNLTVIKTILPFVLVAVFSSGITYQLMSGKAAKVELKEEKKTNKDRAKVDAKLDIVAADHEEKIKEVEKIKYAAKTEWKTEYLTNTVYVDKACSIPASGIQMLDDYADKLNSIGVK